MKVVSPLTYVVSVGEQITLRIIQSIGLAPLVNYSIGGAPTPGTVPKDAPCTFTVTQSVLVGQTAFFTDPSGGSYTTRVSGAPGGDPPDNVHYERAGTEAFHTLIYTFLTDTDFVNLGPDLTALPNVNVAAGADSAPPAKKPRGAKTRGSKTRGSKPGSKRGGRS